MKRLSMALGALALSLTSMPGHGSGQARRQHLGRQLARPGRRHIGKKFTAGDRRGGGIHHRRHHRPAQQGEARQGQSRKATSRSRPRMSAGSTPMTASTRQLDLSKVPNAANLVEQAKISPYHIGTWAYVYTIGYRPDLLQGRDVRQLGGSLEARDEGQARRARFRSEPPHRGLRDAVGRRRGHLGERAGEAQGAEAELQGLSTPTTPTASS